MDTEEKRENYQRTEISKDLGAIDVNEKILRTNSKLKKDHTANFIVIKTV